MVSHCFAGSLFLSNFNVSCNSFSSAILGFKLMTLTLILLDSVDFPPVSIHISSIPGSAQKLSLLHSFPDPCNNNSTIFSPLDNHFPLFVPFDVFKFFDFE